jgi:hypothetical protein
LFPHHVYSVRSLVPMGDRNPDPSFTGMPGVSFDDGLFHTRMRTTQYQRSHELPGSVSRMRAHTSYEGVGGDAGRVEPLGTATIEELVRHHDPSHRFADIQPQPGGPSPPPPVAHFGAHPAHRGCLPGAARPHWGQHPHCPRCPHGEAECPHCRRCPYHREGFHSGSCSGSQPTPYYQQNEFWQPRWVDNASPATAVWHPFSGFVYWDSAACRWVQISPKR